MKRKRCTAEILVRRGGGHLEPRQCSKPGFLGTDRCFHHPRIGMFFAPDFPNSVEFMEECKP